MIDPPLLVAIEAIRQHACPVATPPWMNAEDLTPADVHRALARGDLMEKPLGAAELPSARHAARIAYLLKAGWQDPISLDVGVPWAPGWLPGWPIADGNHRLYAAILRGDALIKSEISGCLATAEEMFALAPAPA